MGLERCLVWANYSPLLRQNLPEYTTQRSGEIFPAWLVGIGSILCSVWELLPGFLLGGPLLCLGWLSTMHALISTLLNTREGPSLIYGVCSLCNPLCFAFYLMNLAAVVSPQTLSCVSSTQDILWALLHFLLSGPWPGTSLRAGSLDNCRAHLVCFLSLTYYCHPLPHT